MAIQLKATKQYFPVVLFIMLYNFEVREVMFVYMLKTTAAKEAIPAWWMSGRSVLTGLTSYIVVDNDDDDDDNVVLNCYLSVTIYGEQWNLPSQYNN